jgi:fatty-acyl-CoA synthase
MSSAVRDENDLRSIEAEGFDAFLPHRTPYAMLRARAEAHPDRVAIRFLRVDGDRSQDQAVSYVDLVAAIERAAGLFRRLGVGPEDSVAVLMPHTPHAQIAIWAAAIAGRAIPLNYTLLSEHLSSLLKASRAKVAVVLGENPELEVWPQVIERLRRELGLEYVFDADGDGPTAGSDGNFEQIIAQESSGALPDPLPNSIAAYFHTGGTTGAPKLALHTHLNQAFVARATALMCDLRADDVMVNGFPVFHVAGSFVYGLSVLSAGGELLIPGRLGMRNRSFVSSIWKRISEYQVTVIGGVPTVISAINELPVDTDLSSLRAVLTGGSPLPTELADALERKIGKPVRNILGMTECAGVVTIEPLHGSRIAGSTGLRLPFTTVKAVRQDQGRALIAEPCQPGETGVIALSGPNVGPGYSDQSLNVGTFEPGGWLVSGDLGHVDFDGRVFITGRAKDVIIRGGHNIDPGQIENALLQHPAVLSAAAVGQPDSYAGELPVAFVSLKHGASALEADLIAFVKPLMPEPAAHPKRIWILDELPLTPVGKIFKPALRAVATRNAIRTAIERSNIGAGQFGFTSTDDRTTVQIWADPPEFADEIRRALLGMPVSYNVQHKN